MNTEKKFEISQLIGYQSMPGKEKTTELAAINATWGKYGSYALGVIDGKRQERSRRKKMTMKKTRPGGNEVELNPDPDLYQLFNDLSSKSPERIDGFRVRMHKEIDSVESEAKEAKEMHAFIDLLADTCIKAAVIREKSRQDDPCTKPDPAVM